MINETDAFRTALLECEALIPEANRPLSLRLALSLIRQGTPTTAELVPFIGEHWVLAKRTSGIVSRYGESVRCINAKQLDDAYQQALRARVAA